MGGRSLMEAIKLASEGKELKGDEDVEPDSDRCVMISTRSSVKEMIAPGLYSVLSPLTVGFFIGARMLMGLLAGCIGSAAMMAIMMGNAGGAWDNSKKLCEKLNLKKTEQGKACVVGDTVGDPFKDTSGPSLDILLKLMAMVSLLIAPLLDGIEYWEIWYVGLIMLVLCIVATVVLIQKGILTWEDPLCQENAGDPQPKGSAEVQPLREAGARPEYDIPEPMVCGGDRGLPPPRGVQDEAVEVTYDIPEPMVCGGDRGLPPPGGVHDEAVEVKAMM